MKANSDGSLSNKTSLEFYGWALTFNSLMAILTAISLVLVPLINIYALKRYYCESLDLANELKFKSFKALEPELAEHMRKVRKDNVTWA